LKGVWLTLSVAIEHGTNEAWYGRFIDYPGTHARAFNRSTLMEELEKEFQFHLNWMEKHELVIPVIKDFEVVVGEEQHGIKELGESGGEVALFEFDKQLITNAQLNTIIQYMTFNRTDLLELVKLLPASKLEYTPTGKSRNIIQILMHICNAEEWYISRMGEEAMRMYLKFADIPESELDNLPVFKRLESVRKASIKTLKAIIPALKTRVFKRSKFTKYPNESWTAYKILRRFLEHEREHYYNIKEYLGIPPRSLD
jgi:uncharacterized damage-inducible protein DinB/predicted RNase H-like HicB family nuclease